MHLPPFLDEQKTFTDSFALEGFSQVLIRTFFLMKSTKPTEYFKTLQNLGILSYKITSHKLKIINKLLKETKEF